MNYKQITIAIIIGILLSTGIGYARVNNPTATNNTTITVDSIVAESTTETSTFAAPVGMGTTTPDYSLDIEAPTLSNNTFRVKNINSALTSGVTIIPENNQTYLYVYDNQQTGAYASLYMSTTTPPIDSESVSYVDYVELVYDPNNGWGLGQKATLGTDGGLALTGDGGSTAIVLDTSGNAGLGTTTPQRIFSASSGASATTTTQWADVYSGTGKSCFEVGQTDGSIASFYFAGGAMVIETNACI